MSHSASPFVDKALRATCAIAVVKSNPWDASRNTKVTLQDGTHCHANIYGSGFFLDATTGLLLTAEHVRRDCRHACITYASENAKLVVCPYLGGELDWCNAWEA